LSTWLDHLRPPDIRRMLLHRLLGRGMPNVPYTLSDMAADTAGLIRALGLSSAHVFGVSMGGMIAQTMAIETPECMRSMTSMMSTTGNRRYLPKPSALRLLLGRAPRDREEAKTRLGDMMTAFAGPNHPIDREQTEAMASTAWDRIGGRHHAKGFVRQFGALLASGSRREALKSVRVPSLVIHGDADPLVPLAGGRAVARAIPHSRFRVITGLGHTLSPSAWSIIAEELRYHAGLP
jgi:pimeloyl-ACP methyl ester carboxylesterase